MKEKKGLVEDIFGFMIIVLVLILLGLFFFSGSTSKDIETLKAKKGTTLSEQADSMMLALYDTKLAMFDKSYAEILVDACLQGKNKSHVYYGKDLGAIDVEELINPIFDSQFGENRWALQVITKSGNMTYGNVSGNKFVYSYPVPTPMSTEKENVNRIVMYLV